MLRVASANFVFLRVVTLERTIDCGAYRFCKSLALLLGQGRGGVLLHRRCLDGGDPLGRLRPRWPGGSRSCGVPTGSLLKFSINWSRSILPT